MSTSDIEGEKFVELLPLCVKALKEFPTHTDIRKTAFNFFVDAASSNRHSNRALEKSGAVEALAPFLTSDDFDDDEKNVLRDLMIKIMSHGY